MIKSRAVIGAISLTLACASNTLAQDLPDTNLKVSGGNRTQNMFQMVQEPFFNEQLPEASGGAVTTTFGSLEDLGLQGPEVLRLLRLGMFDISEGTLSYMAGENPYFEALDLPGLTADIEEQREMMNGFRDEIAQVMEEQFNVKLLSMSPISLQVVYCNGDVQSLADLEGKTVRTFNRSMAELVEAAGAESVNIPFAEVIPAMERGVADCAVTGTSAGNTARWWEVTDKLVMLPMGWAMTFFGANLDNWNRLDPELQTFISDQFADMEDQQWEQAAADIQDGINCNTGQGECQDGVPAEDPMTLVDLSDEEASQARTWLNNSVLPDWADRCGEDCVAAWNSDVGRVVDIQISAE